MWILLIGHGFFSLMSSFSDAFLNFSAPFHIPNLSKVTCRMLVWLWLTAVAFRLNIARLNAGLLQSLKVTTVQDGCQMRLDPCLSYGQPCRKEERRPTHRGASLSHCSGTSVRERHAAFQLLGWISHYSVYYSLSHSLVLSLCGLIPNTPPPNARLWTHTTHTIFACFASLLFCTQSEALICVCC